MSSLLPLAALAILLSAPGPATQADPVAMFERGVSFEAFLASARARRDLWLQNAGRAAPSEAMVQRLKAAGDGLRILAIAEASCSDSVSTIPYVATLAEQAGVALRIVGRAEGLAFMEQHPTPDGRPATPTVVLLRGSRVAGVFVERPSALQAWMLSEAAQALPVDERVSRKMSWYDWDRGESTVAELVVMAEANVH